MTTPRGFFAIDFRRPKPAPARERAYEVVLGYGTAGVHTFVVDAVSHADAVDKAHERALAETDLPKMYRTATVRYRDRHAA